MLDPGLYVVATPIGNLEDITYRAVKVLSAVNCIAAEDTRHSRVLLNHYGIETRLISLHDHNESDRTPEIIDRVIAGEAIALISDAGTPLISDPGYVLVKEMSNRKLPVFTIPGPSAGIAALSVAGLPSDRFHFEGFLPAKTTARKKRLSELLASSVSMIFFESSHRITGSIADMADVFGPDRKAAVCRELTKKFETTLRGDFAELIEQLNSDSNQQKGEFVVVVGGNQSDGIAVDGIELALLLREYLPASQAAKVASKISGSSRKELYSILNEM